MDHVISTHTCVLSVMCMERAKHTNTGRMRLVCLSYHQKHTSVCIYMKLSIKFFVRILRTGSTRFNSKKYVSIAQNRKHAPEAICEQILLCPLSLIDSNVMAVYCSCTIVLLCSTVPICMWKLNLLDFARSRRSSGRRTVRALCNAMPIYSHTPSRNHSSCTPSTHDRTSHIYSVV